MTYGADWFSVVVVLAAAAFYVYDYLRRRREPEEGRSNTPSGSGRPTRFRWPSTSAGSNWRSTIAPNRSRRSRDQSGYRSEDRRTLAAEFESLDELHRADRDRLEEEIHDIGPSTADAIEEHLER